LGKEAKLSYSGNLLVENRNGFIVDSRVWEATGTAPPLSSWEEQDTEPDFAENYGVDREVAFMLP
jgi:hypothetical protein